jgi:hypothetical protein
MKLTKNRFLIPYKKKPIAVEEIQHHGPPFDHFRIAAFILCNFNKIILLFLPSGDLQRQLSDDPITVQLGILIGIFFYADFLGNRLAVVYFFNPNPGGLVANMTSKT